MWRINKWSFSTVCRCEADKNGKRYCFRILSPSYGKVYSTTGPKAQVGCRGLSLLFL